MIERTEEVFVTHEGETCAANDWIVSRPDWEARIIAAHLLTSSAEEAARRSRARRDALAAFPGRLSQADFDWVTPPVLNPYTRIASVDVPGARNPARRRLRGRRPGALPEQVTQVREVTAAAA